MKKNKYFFKTVLSIIFIFSSVVWIIKNIDKIKQSIQKLTSLSDKFVVEIKKLTEKLNCDQEVEEKKEENTISKEKYDGIETDFKDQNTEEDKGETKDGTEDLKNNGFLNQRQKGIISYVRNMNSISMSELSRRFSDVSPRTLRRDMDKLQSMSIVSQQGKTRDSIYLIN